MGGPEGVGGGGGVRSHSGEGMGTGAVRARCTPVTVFTALTGHNGYIVKFMLEP